MKTRMIDERNWTLALWVGWSLALAMFVFGAAVQVDFTEPRVPFFEACGRINLDRLEMGFQKSEYSMVWGFSLISVLTHTFATTWRIRFGAMFVGFVLPILAITPLMAVIMFLSPLLVFEILLGTPDGEFYNEEIPLIGACGLWMILCLIFAGRLALVGWREKNVPVKRSTQAEINGARER